MRRKLLKDLTHWKKKKNRKPLVLKGVRQTGKTYLLKEFGKSHFEKSHYINFEKDNKAHTIFKNNLNPKSILQELSFLLDTSIDLQKDLVIFDEIQAFGFH